MNSNRSKDRAARPERAEAPSPGQRPGYNGDITKSPCFTLIEQALSVFLTLIIFNDPWVLPDEVCVIVFTFFHEGEYDP